MAQKNSTEQPGSTACKLHLL